MFKLSLRPCITRRKEIGGGGEGRGKKKGDGGKCRVAPPRGWKKGVVASSVYAGRRRPPAMNQLI